MSDFPVSRIMDFVRTVEPFNTLDRSTLEGLVQQMEIAFYPKGQAIIRRGDRPPEHLNIIQVGSARITITDDSGKEMLVDERGEGDVFGAVSLLKGNEALFDITAEEDIIAFLLPAEIFRNLVADHPVFRRHFGFSLARDIRAVTEAVVPSQTPPTELILLTPTMFLADKRISDLMVRDVLTCAPETTIRDAARRMARLRVASIVIEREGGIPIGIITDRDLRGKVLAEGHDIYAPVTEVMSHQLHTVSPKAYAFDALLDMSRHDVSHLVVTEDDRLVGIISDHDFRLEIGSSPVGVIGDIEKSGTVDELIRVRPKVDHVREMLLRQGGSVERLVQLVAQLNDRVTQKLLALIEQDMEEKGMGQPPVPYCWISLGSEGRNEQTLRTDQDNALAFVDAPREDLADVKKWFIAFSERVVDGLVRYGFPRCPGGIMASNPLWCQSEAQWEDTFLRWVDDPNPLTLRMASIFFDFRSLYEGTEFLKALRQKLNIRVKLSVFFLRFMAKNMLYNRPPLGFLRQFVVEKSGEHKNKLNLKMRGLTPIVDCARILALDLGINATNTLERMEGAKDGGVLSAEIHSDLKEAYNFINYLRIIRHLEARSRGEEPDNFVDPATLNSLQRKMLKESFSLINRLQEMLEFRYQTQFIVET